MPRPHRGAPATSERKRNASSSDEREQSNSSKRAKEPESEPVETSKGEEEQNAHRPSIQHAQAQVLTPYPSIGGLGLNRFSSDIPDTKDIVFSSPPDQTLLWNKPDITSPRLLALNYGGPGTEDRGEQPKLELPGTTGPLTDPTVGRDIILERLDLDVSYVELYKRGTPKPARRPRQPRWQHRGDEPLVDPMKFPTGWNSNEPDLEPDDYESQIARCDERIEDNINPYFFEVRKREYMDMKDALEKWMQGEPKGLSRATYERLDTLKSIKQAIDGGHDPLQEKENVDAILKAYRSGQLEWIPDLVTYWSKGNQLCLPRRFDWDEFQVINEAHAGHKSFWVEGIGAPNGSSRNDRVTIWPYRYQKYLKFYKFHVRFPGYNYHSELEFLHDTGASDMSIFEDDIQGIMGPGGYDFPFLKVAGYVKITGAGHEETPLNTTIVPLAAIEATIVTEEEDPAKERLRMTPWTRAWTTLNKGRANLALGNYRVDGPWLRHRLYMGSAPDGTDRIHAAMYKGDLHLKRVHPRDTPGLVNDPPPILPTPGTFLPVTGRRDKVPLPNLGSVKRIGRPVFTDV